MFKTRKNQRFLVPRKLRFSRESQSISINTIIIAAIALAVLVVLFVIFTGRTRIFSEDVDKTTVSCSDACTIGAYQSGSDIIGGRCDSGIKITIKGRECCCQRQ